MTNGNDSGNFVLQQIIRLRIIVGYLGEKAQYNWWPSEFFSDIAPAFLNPVFGKTTILAQYHGIKESAKRVHDDHIGIGRVFHLFRLPESMEQAVFDSLQDFSITEEPLEQIASQDCALTALRVTGRSSESFQEGPVQIGLLSDLLDGDWLLAAAHHYERAFNAGSRCYPYLTDGS